MNIVFFGTSNVALPILETLSRHHTISAVVTQPDALAGRQQEMQESPVSVLAREMNLQTLKPETVKNNDWLTMELKSLQADLFIVVSYGKILPAEIISMPPLGTLNVHFSLLPKYRGASPIQFAIMNGEEFTGTSIMLLDEQLDHGPIVTAERYAIENDDNFLTLSEKLAHASAKLLDLALPDFSAGRLKPTAQDESEATYTKIISKADGRVDWNKPAEAIYNQFRAFYPWPGIWTEWNGKKIKILDCAPSPVHEAGQVAGTVLEGGYVACGDSTKLQIRSLQLEGKTQTDIQSFLNGYGQFLGSKLGSSV